MSCLCKAGCRGLKRSSGARVCMTPFTFFLLLVGLWSSIHLVHRFYVPANKSRNLLPTSLTTRKRTFTAVTVAGPYLRVESTAFNSGHDILAQWFSRNRISHVPAALRVIFDLGIVVSLLGMVCALAVLVWTFVQLARKSVADLVPQTAGVHPHAKRAYDSIYAPPTVTPRTTTDIPVQLLVRTPFLLIRFLRAAHPPTQIPGITLPLSDFPLLISALFFSQAIHEAGHALSAAVFVLSIPPSLHQPLMFPTGTVYRYSHSAHP
jgi:S2P endopeptidase